MDKSLGNTTKQIIEVLNRFEKQLKSNADVDSGGKITFQNPWSIDIDKVKLEIQKLLQKELNSILKKDIELKKLPELINANNILNFHKALKKQVPNLVYLIEFTDLFSEEDLPWYPFYDAISIYFSATKISKLDSKVAYEYILKAMLHTDDENFESFEDTDWNEFVPQLDALRQHKFATKKNIEEISEIISRYDGSAFIYTPPEIIFKGSSKEMEDNFSNWLERYLTTPLIMEVSFKGLDKNHNFESLIESWHRHSLNDSAKSGKLIWHTTMANVPVNFEFDKKKIKFKIHRISQLADPAIGPDFSIPTNPRSEYKVTMFRTGTRNEYDQSMDKSFLALQVLIVSENLNCPLENIKAEIDWLRVYEKDYPLEGLSENEIKTISNVYLDSRK
jgi:hypothetical protein